MGRSTKDSDPSFSYHAYGSEGFRAAPAVAVRRGKTRDRVVLGGRVEDVHVPITVDVDGGGVVGTGCRVRDDALRERLRPVVLVPGDRVVVGGRREHVHVAVAVDVAREDHAGAGRRVVDEAATEGDAA